MEYFLDAKSVRLRSAHGKYLVANSDKTSVHQEMDYKESSIWTVECINNNSTIRLQSCHGLYLCASDHAFLLGMTGRKVVQSKIMDKSTEWQPLKEGHLIKLTNRGSYLRANGGPPPWKSSITHDLHSKLSAQNLLWEVEIVESKRENAEMQKKMKPNSDGRVVYYALAMDDGGLPSNTMWRKYIFKGQTLKELNQSLKEELKLTENIIVCGKHCLNGVLYRLHMDLPPNNAAMRVVVVKSASDGARNLHL